MLPICGTGSTLPLSLLTLLLLDDIIFVVVISVSDAGTERHLLTMRRSKSRMRTFNSGKELCQCHAAHNILCGTLVDKGAVHLGHGH
jgi:hypothetical protein